MPLDPLHAAALRYAGRRLDRAGRDRHERLWTIIDGPRRGLRRAWIYVVMSLFASFGFAMGLYLAAQERQLRWNARPR